MPTSTLPHLEVSQALLDEISARADEAERAGNLPLDLVEADARRRHLPHDAAHGPRRLRDPPRGADLDRRTALARRRLDGMDRLDRRRRSRLHRVARSRGRARRAGPERRPVHRDGVRSDGSASPWRRGRARPVRPVAVRQRMPSCALVLHRSVRVRRRCTPFHRGRPRLATRAVPERPGRDHRQLGRARHAARRGATTSKPAT